MAIWNPQPTRDRYWRAYDVYGERIAEADTRKALLAQVAETFVTDYDVYHFPNPWWPGVCDGDCGLDYGFRTRRDALAHDAECPYAERNRREMAAFAAQEG